ncbi:hypothetical protein [Devosia sp. 2618]|uniref:hypothetical protein n=1 Tax=Devosia sp. 2618 TaxID=3156454 RepID=UPI00339767CF
MTTIAESADFMTEVQRACRVAKDSKLTRDLSAAARLMDSARFGLLPDEAQQDLHFAYAEAAQAVTGFGA